MVVLRLLELMASNVEGAAVARSQPLSIPSGSSPNVDLFSLSTDLEA